MDEQKKQQSNNSQTALDKTLQILGAVFKIAGSVIVWCFFASLFIMGTLFWLLDKWLGDGRNPVRAPWDKPHRNSKNFDFDAWKKKNSKQSGEEFVKNNLKFRPDNQQEKIVYQLIQEKKDRTLEEIISEMSEEEFELFITMLLRALGITIL